MTTGTLWCTDSENLDNGSGRNRRRSNRISSYREPSSESDDSDFESPPRARRRLPVLSQHATPPPTTMPAIKKPFRSALHQNTSNLVLASDIGDDDDDDDESSFKLSDDDVTVSSSDLSSAQSSDNEGHAEDDDDFEMSSSLRTDLPMTMESTGQPSESAASHNSRRRRQSAAGQRSMDTNKTREKKKLSAKERADLNLIEWHPELNIDWDELEQENKERLARISEVEQPEQLTNVKLLPYQKESLAWFVEQEEGKFNGGILADEMGMGKTLQMITLLVSRPIGSPTLIICPVVAMIQWKEEIEKYTRPGSLKVLIFHGASRTDSADTLRDYDIILTSYAVVESCYRKQQSGFTRKGGKVFEQSLVHSIHWGRIILDEAHNIKDRSCSTARAVFNLKSTKKWSLSGTPLQNRVGELYSLIRFIQVSPYSSYYCTKCPCKTSSWKFSDHSHCDECGHKPMQHFCWWNRTILKPIQKFGAEGEGREAFERLVILLDQMMLRRTKIERADDLGLPPRIVEIRRDYFNEKEMDFYRSLYSATRTQFASYVRTGTVLNNFAHIFELLSRLRQAADHPFLVVHKKGNNSDNPGTYVCGLCHEVAEDPIAARCKHVFCREDIRQYLESYLEDERSAECPVCFTRLTINLDQEELPPPAKLSLKDDRHCGSIVNRMLNSSGGVNEPTTSNSHSGSSSALTWTSSTKIEALLEELNSIRESDHTIKSIVFSQFVSFLDLVYWRLRKAGYHCVKLDGRMTPEQRDSVIKTFMTVPQVTVFLVSLKAGGVALNLTEASRVFIMDPWWNPAAEDQAMDRIHRLGQYRAVRITRLVIEDSIESRIIQLQEKKKLLFQSTVGKDGAALERLAEEDLHFLFQM